MIQRPGPKPEWSSWNKEASLVAYGEWHNDLARASFIHDQGHPDMFFLVSETGELSGLQFRDGLDAAAKNDAVRRAAAEISPYGTIHVRVATLYNVPGINFAVGAPDDVSRRCLSVHLESRAGTSKMWVSPIVETVSGLELEATVIAGESPRSSGDQALGGTKAASFDPRAPGPGQTTSEQNPEPLEFFGSLMEGPDLDVLAFAHLDLLDDEEDRLWRETSPYYLLEECAHVYKNSLWEHDSMPGYSDEFFEYSISDVGTVVAELREAVRRYLKCSDEQWKAILLRSAGI